MSATLPVRAGRRAAACESCLRRPAVQLLRLAGAEPFAVCSECAPQAPQVRVVQGVIVDRDRRPVGPTADRGGLPLDWAGALVERLSVAALVRELWPLAAWLVLVLVLFFTSLSLVIPVGVVGLVGACWYDARRDRPSSMRRGGGRHA